MKIQIVDYEKLKHENFVKSYIVSCINHGFIYDLTEDKKKMLISYMLATLDTSVIKMAINSEATDEFVGFAIGEDSIIPTLKFIYVKKQHQRHGIGSLLLDNVLDNNIGEIVVMMKSPNLNLFFKRKGIKPVVRFFTQITKQ